MLGRQFDPEVAPSRADLGLTEECRQFPHRIAFLCFAGDAVVAFACLLVAFWLRFDTAAARVRCGDARDHPEQLFQLYHFRFRFFVAGARSEADVRRFLASPQALSAQECHRRLPCLGSRISWFFTVLQVSATALEGLCGVGNGHGHDRALYLASFVF